MKKFLFPLFIIKLIFINSWFFSKLFLLILSPIKIVLFSTLFFLIYLCFLVIQISKLSTQKEEKIFLKTNIKSENKIVKKAAELDLIGTNLRKLQQLSPAHQGVIYNLELLEKYQ